MNPREEDRPDDASTYHIRALVPPSLEELNALVPAYEFLEFVDHGGMGVVYKARQKSLNRVVAIKTMPPANQNRRTFADRFKREAEALASLNHPHIVAVHDFGETTSGILYYVMEFVKGSNLRRLLKGRGLNSRHMLTIITQVCSALQYAHDHGVVHRDIKPGNILMDEAGNAKVADFGLAKVLGLPHGTHQLTSPLEPLGTPDYIAPEVLEGDKDVDHRADIFSLGVMLYEMATGHLPKGDWEQPSLCGADSRLDEVVSRALQADPQRRYQQVSDLTQELQELLEPSDTLRSTWKTTSAQAVTPVEDGIHEEPPTTTSSAPVAHATRPAVRWASRLLLALLFFGGAGVALWQFPAARVWLGLSKTTQHSPGASPQTLLSTPPPSKDTSPAARSQRQRTLANWVLEHGGHFNIALASQDPDKRSENNGLLSEDRLPDEESVVWRVNFNEVETLDDKDLPELVRIMQDAGCVSHLSLRGTRVTGRGLESLPMLKETLTNLNLRHTAALSARSLPFISACDHLKRLFVTIHDAASDNGLVEELKSKLPDSVVFPEESELAD